MGTIQSGVGLISGINTAQLIDQLLAIDARPKQLIERRNAVLTSQQVAYQDINAKLLVLKLSAAALTDAKIFKSTTGTSSQPDVLKVSTSSSAVPGTYSFTVDRLVTTQQSITRGFADESATPIAPAGGTLTFEFGDGRLDSDTSLSQLNGGQGVPRGKIRITDRSGASAIVDLSKALTVKDVLAAINDASFIHVTAAVEGDRLVITDNTGAAAANLSVADVGFTGTATALGLAGSAAGATLTGTHVNTVGDDTALALLNDGNGVRIKSSVPDFQITLSDGSAVNVDISGASSLGAVIQVINDAGGGSVTAGYNSAGTGLQLTDNTAGGTTFAVTALNGSLAAADLGILAADGDGDGQIEGDRLLAGLNSKLIKNLNGGSGGTLGTIGITNRAGVLTQVDLAAAASVADVIRLINNSGAGITAALNSAGNGLKLVDNTGGAASNFIISGAGAADLGIDQSVASATMQSGNLQVRYLSEATSLASLNGGNGITRGKFTITDSSGASGTVDLTQGDEVTIGHVINEINSRGLQINARINDTGDGILIEDLGPGTSAIKIAEAGSTTARDLGLLGEASSAGANFDGSFERTVTIDPTDTLAQVRDKINSAGLNVNATVLNDRSGVNPYRLSLLSTNSGRAGAFLLDDGGLGFNTTTLVEARDAVVFYGSSDPAQAIAITSSSTTLTDVVPGATITLTGTSTNPVQITIARDTSAVTEAVKKLVTDFNSVVDTLNKYDKYNPETKERGLLLGDSTVSIVRNALFRLVNNRNGDVSGQYNMLAQVGVRVASGSRLTFDAAKFEAALANDPAAVQELFTLKQTATNETTGAISLTAGGIGVRIDDLLKNLTDSQRGPVLGQIEIIKGQIDLNKKRITQIDALLENKRLKLQRDFTAMERALAQLQSQGTALASLQSLAAQTQAR